MDLLNKQHVSPWFMWQGGASLITINCKQLFLIRPNGLLDVSLPTEAFSQGGWRWTPYHHLQRNAAIDVPPRLPHYFQLWSAQQVETRELTYPVNQDVGLMWFWGNLSGLKLAVGMIPDPSLDGKQWLFLFSHLWLFKMVKGREVNKPPPPSSSYLICILSLPA